MNEREEPEITADGGEKQTDTEEDASAKHDSSPAPHVAQDTQKRLDDISYQVGNAEEQANLGVIEVYVVADEGPCRFAHAKYKLVEELD